MIWVLLAIALFALLYIKCVKPAYYWKERGVPQTNSKWIFSDGWKMLLRQKSLPDMSADDYNLHPNARYSGVYQLGSPTLVLRSPELIRQITVKDFEHFVDHRQFISEEVDPLWASNLLTLRGEKWRTMRATLSPAFTSSKMKAMFTLMSECAERFVDFFQEMLGNEELKSIEMKDSFTRYTNDIIASCAFGITCDSLKNQHNEFYLMGKDATNFSSFWQILKILLCGFAPNIAKILGITLLSQKVRNFFIRIIKESIRTREEKGIVRQDMIHLLLEARKGRLIYDELNTKDTTEFAAVEESAIGKSVANTKKDISDMDITAQALIFFFAGFDGVATLMSFATYALAVHPEIQEKLYREFKGVDGKLTYEALQKMKYLDMVVSETLRMWPSTINLDRVCVKPYTIQPELPHEKPVHLQKDDVILVPIYGLHHDPNYYPNPSKFDPERFSDENKQNIIPYTYLPFGSGRNSKCVSSTKLQYP